MVNNFSPMKSEFAPATNARRNRFDVKENVAASAEPNHGCGHQNTRGRNHPDEHQWIEWLLMPERCPRDADKRVDGHAFRMWIHRVRVAAA